MRDKPAVYILASHKKGTIYTGVTSDIKQRVYQHKTGALGGFTKKYDVKQLVYVEFHPTMQAAIRREKQIKEWRRQWKVDLIEKDNPDWLDRYDDLS